MENGFVRSTGESEEDMAQRWEKLTREAVNYSFIAKLKAQINAGKKPGEKANVTDFLALARNNDPF